MQTILGWKKTNLSSSLYHPQIQFTVLFLPKIFDIWHVFTTIPTEDITSEAIPNHLPSQKSAWWRSLFPHMFHPESIYTVT